MQILTPDFIDHFPHIINIHHSFLPAFAGAIIEQDVVRVSHRDTIADLIRKGKDLERVVLARAVRLHLEHRVLVYGNRTVVLA